MYSYSWSGPFRPLFLNFSFFWMCLVFVAARGLSLAAASGDLLSSCSARVSLVGRGLQVPGLQELWRPA